MKISVLSTVAISIFSSCSATLHLVKKDTPSVLHLDIAKKTTAHAAVEQLLKWNFNDLGYYASITVGTPPQALRVLLDTGSSDTWFKSKASQYCQSKPDPASCDGSGTYDANASSTYKYLNDQFATAYVDGSGASGDYGTDDVTVGNISLTGLQVGVATKIGVGMNTEVEPNVMGVGYASNEAQVKNHVNSTAYDNTPMAMFRQGFIRAPAYSLWLNDVNTNTGSILFGGVDSDKYIDPLSTVPIIPDSETGAYTEFKVNLNTVTVSKDAAPSKEAVPSGPSAGTIDPPLPVLLDSGSSYTRLSSNITDTIYASLRDYNVTDETELTTCSCSLVNSTEKIYFNFSGAIIPVPAFSLVDATILTSDGKCRFGIITLQPGQSVILGASFLRSAYVVYDLANNEISIARTLFDATDSNIHEIAPGKDGVPGAHNVTVTP